MWLPCRRLILKLMWWQMVFKKCHNLHLVERWKWIKGPILPPHSSLELQCIQKLECKTLKTGHNYSMWTQLNYIILHLNKECDEISQWFIVLFWKGFDQCLHNSHLTVNGSSWESENTKSNISLVSSGPMRWRLVTWLHKNMAFTVQWLQVLIQSPFIFRAKR